MGKIYTCRFRIYKYDDMIIEIDVIDDSALEAQSLARTLIAERLEIHPDRLDLCSVTEC